MKKLNKWIAGLLCMMLVMTMVAGLGVTEVKADDAVTTVSSWNELKNAISNGLDLEQVEQMDRVENVLSNERNEEGVTKDE